MTLFPFGSTSSPIASLFARAHAIGPFGALLVLVLEPRLLLLRRLGLTNGEPRLIGLRIKTCDGCRCRVRGTSAPRRTADNPKWAGT